MTGPGGLVRLLRNTAVRELISALERDGFRLRRTGRSGGRIYKHPDGRTTVIHYHSGGDRLARKTLASILQATLWTQEDLRRLRLI